MFVKRSLLRFVQLWNSLRPTLSNLSSLAAFMTFLTKETLEIVHILSLVYILMHSVYTRINEIKYINGVITA